MNKKRIYFGTKNWIGSKEEFKSRIEEKFNEIEEKLENLEGLRINKKYARYATEEMKDSLEYYMENFPDLAVKYYRENVKPLFRHITNIRINDIGTYKLKNGKVKKLYEIYDYAGRYVTTTTDGSLQDFVEEILIREQTSNESIKSMSWDEFMNMKKRGY